MVYPRVAGQPLEHALPWLFEAFSSTEPRWAHLPARAEGCLDLTENAIALRGPAVAEELRAVPALVVEAAHASQAACCAPRARGSLG